MSSGDDAVRRAVAGPLGQKASSELSPMACRVYDVARMHHSGVVRTRTPGEWTSNQLRSVCRTDPIYAPRAAPPSAPVSARSWTRQSNAPCQPMAPAQDPARRPQSAQTQTTAATRSFRATCQIWAAMAMTAVAAAAAAAAAVTVQPATVEVAEGGDNRYPASGMTVTLLMAPPPTAANC